MIVGIILQVLAMILYSFTETDVPRFLLYGHMDSMRGAGEILINTMKVI